ncbi:MAG TPA: glutamine--fructose-6-phosphate transaminase (isomerizing) [candidate division Zixibacteria bacterium]|nr:glutamine--fructose-6-phosphate transaminase (isomerizing) [candidate division Zixibacteria bacterium]
MCGIIGYIGKNTAPKILLESLKRLEYRGYDSCGMACINGNTRIDVRKGEGRIESVNQRKNFLSLDGNIGIAHTRWATHGKVEDNNAHPFLSCDEEFALVHNGILENYQELKEKLINQGHKFNSSTDTEVLVHLIEEKMKSKNNGQILDAITEISQEAKGAFTFLLLSRSTGEIYAFRKDSPIIIGLGDGELFASSDITSFLKYTNKAIILENYELAVLGKECKIYNLKTQKQIKKKITTIEWTAEQATKNGYPHFMLKEIFEETEVSKHSLEQNSQKLKEITNILGNAKKVFFLGSGTSYRACLTASIYFAKIAKRNFMPILGSEFKTYQNIVDKDTVLFAISQSGETADVLEGIQIAKSKGAKIISLVNVMGSTIMRESDHYLTINAGPEIAVASTKAFTSQVFILVLLAYALANQLVHGRELLMEIIDNLEKIMSLSDSLFVLSKEVLNKNDLYLIGRGAAYPVAMEGELKIKEIAYIHADALAGGELKHHTLALIEPGVPCIALVPDDDTKDDMINNIMQIKARGGTIIGISSDHLAEFDHYISIPKSPLEPLYIIPILQLISYHLSVIRGNDPDFPRNLAKSVTVL